MRSAFHSGDLRQADGLVALGFYAWFGVLDSPRPVTKGEGSVPSFGPLPFKERANGGVLTNGAKDDRGRASCASCLMDGPNESPVGGEDAGARVNEATLVAVDGITPVCGTLDGQDFKNRAVVIGFPRGFLMDGPFGLARHFRRGIKAPSEGPDDRRKEEAIGTAFISLGRA